MPSQFVEEMYAVQCQKEQESYYKPLNDDQYCFVMSLVNSMENLTRMHVVQEMLRGEVGEGSLDTLVEELEQDMRGLWGALNGGVKK